METTSNAPESLLGAAPTEPEVNPFVAEGFEWPEGIEETERTELSEFASAHKMSSEAMKAMLDMHTKAMKDAADRLTTGTESAWNEQVNGFVAETRKAYGDNLPAITAKCESVLDEFGSQGLRDQLVATGLGSNLAVFQFLEKVADAIGEAKPVNSEASPATANPLDKLYPSMVKKD